MIETKDAKFDMESTTALLQSAGATTVERLEDV
jgi:hypothetical protein